MDCMVLKFIVKYYTPVKVIGVEKKSTWIDKTALN